MNYFIFSFLLATPLVLLHYLCISITLGNSSFSDSVEVCKLIWKHYKRLIRSTLIILFETIYIIDWQNSL